LTMATGPASSVIDPLPLVPVMIGSSSAPAMSNVNVVVA